MNISFRPPLLQDLESIMEIERASFTVDEAASEKAMKERISIIKDSFWLQSITTINRLAMLLDRLSRSGIYMMNYSKKPV